jgi:hypothetical protein
MGGLLLVGIAKFIILPHENPRLLGHCANQVRIAQLLLLITDISTKSEAFKPNK